MFHQHSGSIEKLPFCVEKYISCDDGRGKNGRQECEAGLQVGVVKIRHFTIVFAISFILRFTNL